MHTLDVLGLLLLVFVVGVIVGLAIDQPPWQRPPRPSG